MGLIVNTSKGQWRSGRDWNGGGTVKDLIAFVAEEMGISGKDLQIVDAVVVPQQTPAWILCDREVELVDMNEPRPNPFQMVAAGYFLYWDGPYKQWGWFPTPSLLDVWIERGEIG